MPAYRAVTTPTFAMPGDQDRVVSLPARRRMLGIFPDSRWLPVPECGHVACLEQTGRFFGNPRSFMRAQSAAFTPTI